MLQLKVSLRVEEREELFLKRNRLMLNLTETATILNCTVNHISDAQMGKHVPSEVYNAVMSWVDSE